jgi:pyruvate/2-oxoglutarate/acetoin dehydrogenase E1 component/TPP-dependent pyruvate/acetoin dehydrogenase alpha subunit
MNGTNVWLKILSLPNSVLENMSLEKQEEKATKITFEEYKQIILSDYQLANESRQASLTGRKEVLTGKAKFGIFGDGKEVAQIAMAKAFQAGDWRAGYYRDQTFMMASGLLTLQEFFAQLYAHTDVVAEPSSAGRSMNGHYGTRILNTDGSWKKQTDLKNASSDISPTAAQMPRALGLALASKIYRNQPGLGLNSDFSNSGNEVAFATIGDASTSEGHFWETINAAGVMQVPLAVSVWDDGYGISVPKKYQTTKESISEVLAGFEKQEGTNGIKIYIAKGWNYAELVETYQNGIDYCRATHTPVLFHIQEVTQPQGHSTSGSHERYKTRERMEWETAYDCLVQMRKWILENAIASDAELTKIEEDAKVKVRQARKDAWEAYLSPINSDLANVLPILDKILLENAEREDLKAIKEALTNTIDAGKKDIQVAIRKTLRAKGLNISESVRALKYWFEQSKEKNIENYNSCLHSRSRWNALTVRGIPAQFSDQSPIVDGREVLKFNFEKLFETYPNLVAFGEDLGNIGDVNQGFEGLQKKFGDTRIFDNGIRECTIIGQGIGLALRGLRPIAEIQYLDYIFYGLQMLTDDLATLQYRTKGGQKSPAIIRTRGHRLEGIWHSGSPMGSIINAVRGIYVCVPRNMVQAAGMYNLLLQSDDPAIVVEPLNGYRLKERLPENLGEFTVPLGKVEILDTGTDITLVTYGSTLRIAQEAINQVRDFGISVELIDVQTLLPFDLDSDILKSIKKTNRVLFLDEDVPGGASAYMMQQVLVEQGGYRYLDAPPKTLASQPHRPAYSTDGDYFSKPNVEDVVDTLLGIMQEY